jgi:molybdopterin molybdotransferase
MKQFISFEDAQRIVLEAVPRCATVRVGLAGALGYTLAEGVESRDNIPPFDNSAMDGFAVRSADLAALPATLRVVDEIPAGSSPRVPVEAGTCARIMTGAPFPDGADAVAPVEWTTPAEAGAVVFNRAPQPGEHVRRAGRDVYAGQQVFAPGQVITPPVVGMLATLGVPEVLVARPPSVAVMATGDELVGPADTPGPGQIRNSNGPALAAQVATTGAEALPPLLARDDKADIEAVVRQALEADVLVLSGGVSVGDYDYVKEVLDAQGLELIFWKVRQRPGKPLAFGLLRGKPVFGLPGNPVSSAMCFEQYVRPALAQMLGRRVVVRPRHPAVLDAPVPKVGGLHYFARGRAAFGDDGLLHAEDTGPQGSNIYSSVVQANCIIHMPPEMENPPAGTRVEVEWLPW